MHVCMLTQTQEFTNTQVHMNGHTRMQPHRHTGMCTHIHITYTQIIVKFKKIWKLRWGCSNFEKQYEVKVVGSIASFRMHQRKPVGMLPLEVSLVLDQQAYECLSNGSPDKAKAHGDSLTCKDFRTEENTAGNARPECSPLSHKIYDALGCLSVIWSVMHGTDMIIPRNPRVFFFSNIFP